MKLDIETETCEYKKSTAELNDAMKDICAILNKHGQGVLYFGVKPNGVVCGLQITETTLRDVSRKISETIEPKIYPTIEKRWTEMLQAERSEAASPARKPFLSWKPPILPVQSL